MGEAGPGITRARQLRHNQTGPYYADFACLHAGLIVEVDGETHVDERRDFVRDDYMRSRGLHVLRFTNDDVLHHPDAVFTTIAGVLAAVSSASNTPHPVPPPQGGRRPRTPAPAPEAETAGPASPSPLRGGDRGGGTPQPPNSDPATPHPVPPPQGGRRPRTPSPAPEAETAGSASPSPLRGGDRGGGTPLAPDSQLGTPPPPNAGPDPSP